ncbi:molybdate transport system ATP-binding protein [Comamonas odontotermitis]|uniref:Molybdate transport system ATP-binding protein n=1 Tax=Comamonas odontotermitis TaxID=379895 RepID=A0ABR6RHB2_9BURK|nr:molybdenum ABC transporter ATP-binding protein [Comamonas odontotermitis]MBB6578542.1 molybdate transport system ATP-binding protein [Comamonas odontotermitis]
MNESSTSQGIRARLQLQRSDFVLDVDLKLPGQGVTALFGPSGCGKTSLLRSMAGLERARGAVAVNGHVWQDDATRQWLPTHQRALGYVFQEASLFPHLTAEGNIRYGLRRAPASRQSIALEQIIDLLGIAHLLARRPATLSGGERQRVAIARALATSPRVLLMDEPLSALDAERKAEVLPYLDKLSERLALPVLYVSHSIDEVSRLADQILLMQAGRVVAQGEVADVLTRMDAPLTRSLPGDQQASIMEGRVCAHDAQDHLWSMQIGAHTAHQLHWTEPEAHYQPEERVRLRILARDVSLSLAPHTGSSILNSLPAMVTGVQASGPGQVLVQLRLAPGNADTHLLALVSARSARLLQIAPGMAVHAQLKSVAVLH